MSKSKLIFTILIISATYTINIQQVGAGSITNRSKAPDFNLPGISKENKTPSNVSLSSFKNSWLILYFYPEDFTMGCTLEARSFQENINKLNKLGAKVVGISVDDIEKHTSFCQKEALSFPLVADKEGLVSKSYGSYMNGRSLRNTYLINPNGLIMKSWTDVKPYKHAEEVISALKLEQKKSLRKTKLMK